MKFVLDHREDQDLRRSRFTEEHLIGILKEHDLPVSRQAAILGISRDSVYYLPRFDRTGPDR